MKPRKPKSITEALNRVYTNEDSKLEPELVEIQLLSIKDNAPRVPGIDKGKIIIQPDFDEPLEKFEE
ncbi:MAG: hypothetical protein FJZ86_06130 [Chloroflexi bacterium]|nr:hypothetical protein [Chloroflexota bacterium]